MATTKDKPRRASARAINKAGASISSSASPATAAASKASFAAATKKPPSASKRVLKKPIKYERVGPKTMHDKGFMCSLCC